MEFDLQDGDSMNRGVNLVLIVFAVLMLTKTLLPYLVSAFFNFPALFAEFIVMLMGAILTIFLIYPLLKKGGSNK